ncbi:MAG: 4'-phosphopantetheinyl transferase superfamily protein [Deltaproteobacteria bacterium]|nr:4'-phosphopantetheinyl transferase superfamily protein [Deltaproteobacteria bacterium]
MRIFLASLDALPELTDLTWPRLAAPLAPHRAQKALAMAREGDRRRALLAGLALRMVLGVAADGDLAFGPDGKPFLAKGGPEFSLSHSGGHVALSVGGPAHGLDVQELRDKAVPESLARWALCPEELALLAQNPDPALFTRLWAMKEAYVKATGRGLSGGFGHFSALPPAPGPRTVEGRSVWFYLADLPGATLALACLGPSFPPSILSLDGRLRRWAESLPGQDPDPGPPLYRPPGRPKRSGPDWDFGANPGVGL